MRTSHGEQAFGILLLAALLGVPLWHILHDSVYDNPAVALPMGIARPPHVALVKPDEVTIAYTTHVATRGGVLFARLDEPDIRVSPDVLTREHVVRLQALQADTQYTYQVIVDGHPRGPRHTFHTAPAADATVRVVLVGDTGSGSRRQARVIDRVLALAPDLVLHTGDLAYPRGTPPEVQARFVLPFMRVRDHLPMLTTLGNHDVKTRDGEPFLDAIVLPTNDVTGDERFYVWRHGPLEVVCIDTEAPLEPGTPQHAWLERVLSEPAPGWRLVFGHRAIHAGSRSGGDDALQKHLVPLLEAHGVPLYCSGHDHVYMRTFPLHEGRIVAREQEPDYLVPLEPAAPIYLVTGGGGKSLYEVHEVPHNAEGIARDHAVLMVVSPESVRVSAVDVEGEVLDAFSLRRRRAGP